MDSRSLAAGARVSVEEKSATRTPSALASVTIGSSDGIRSTRFLICMSSSAIIMFHAFEAAFALPITAGTSLLDIASEFA
jgi:hypothetical protein